MRWWIPIISVKLQETWSKQQYKQQNKQSSFLSKSFMNKYDKILLNLFYRNYRKSNKWISTSLHHKTPLLFLTNKNEMLKKLWNKRKWWTKRKEKDWKTHLRFKVEIVQRCAHIHFAVCIVCFRHNSSNKNTSKQRNE